MPALAFGLNAARSGPSKPAQKRKAFFDQDDDAPEDVPAPAYGAKKSSKPLRPLTDLGDDEDEGQPPKKSPKLSSYGLQPAKGKSPGPTLGSDKYTNLSALRSAKLHDEEASKLDASVYDYDAVYDTFHAHKEKNSNSGAQDSGPKYMGSLLQSAEVRKRDQLRAREKLLQREREAEGDEFADKEKFVTGAYKKQQEEIRKMEEEEKKREEAEEERRRKGGGMTAFHKRMLEKDEERMQMIKEAEEQAAERKERGVEVEQEADEETSDAKIAEDLNKRGARVVVNDEGEVVDKRQLLSAGLNVAPKKPGKEQQATTKQEGARPQEYWRSSKALDAREAQRERQSRMMERQIEDMLEKQKQAEAEENKAQQEKNKSRVTEADKMSARERYLQRKKEREEEARKKKEAGSGG
ncbi:hypothetical protein G647_08405 [Cladophialophora carrionii CBS 160.54]|uniref:Nuclear speckle splicing regulatory protein 1 N-terminal domain-containing protein n=1 Tax=Cladophialophora carrionii CBS 160.54 TaxID=1279043 RepID=V9D0G8_9EURO|nr:uncharacterized protein G647_08405 [Cladophialophora carrionii CBS 160.54]ETI20370.1 hypothetical protein G647_08405 [Cladophialophora carrionii CBS 160.54]